MCADSQSEIYCLFIFRPHVHVCVCYWRPDISQLTGWYIERLINLWSLVSGADVFWMCISGKYSLMRFSLCKSIYARAHRGAGMLRQYWSSISEIGHYGSFLSCIADVVCKTSLTHSVKVTLFCYFQSINHILNEYRLRHWSRVLNLWGWPQIEKVISPAVCYHLTFLYRFPHIDFYATVSSMYEKLSFLTMKDVSSSENDPTHFPCVTVQV